MKGIIYIESGEQILRDKPEGELLWQDYYKDYYFMGIKVYRRKIDYCCSLNGKPSSAGFK